VAKELLIRNQESIVLSFLESIKVIGEHCHVSCKGEKVDDRHNVKYQPQEKEVQADQLSATSLSAQTVPSTSFPWHCHHPPPSYIKATWSPRLQCYIIILVSFIVVINNKGVAWKRIWPCKNFLTSFLQLYQILNFLKQYFVIFCWDFELFVPDRYLIWANCFIVRWYLKCLFLKRDAKLRLFHDYYLIKFLFKLSLCFKVPNLFILLSFSIAEILLSGLWLLWHV